MLNQRTAIALALATSVALATAGSAAAGDSNGNFQVKIGGADVLTQDHTSSLTANGVNLLPLGDHAVTDDMIVPKLTLTYYLNRNIGLELFCCFSKTSVVGAGNLPHQQLANTWIFPPVLTAQYHIDGFGAFRPYVGAGVQWMHYFDEGVADNGLGATHVHFRDSVGPVVQAGFDYDLGGGWSVGADVKKVWEDTKITWEGALGGGTTVVAVHDLDPVIVSANIGYRFNLEDLFGRRAAAAPLK